MKDLSIYFENQRVVGDFKPGQLGTSIVQAGASFYQDSPLMLCRRFQWHFLRHSKIQNDVLQ